MTTMHALRTFLTRRNSCNIAWYFVKVVRTARQTEHLTLVHFQLSRQ